MTVREWLTAHSIALEGVLAAQQGGEVLELEDTVRRTSGRLTPLTLKDEEGRRIYERSIRFVMLLALKRLYPRQQVRIEYSIGHGVFVRLPRLTVSREMVAEVEELMRALIASDLPYEKRTWQVADAVRYFERDGQTDKVALLHHRTVPTMTLYGCGGMWEYFYGAMTPSTGYTKVFQLIYHAPGFVLQLPTAEDPDHPAPYIDRPKHLAIFSESAAWCEVLGVMNAADADAMIEQHRLREFIRVNEALHDRSIAEIAESIVRRGRQLILVAGPSSSGKTTFAARLCVHLRVLGKHPVQLSLDNYYRNRDEIPREADGSVDLEHINTLDLELFQRQMAQLIAGEEVEVPVFSFTTGKRKPKGIPLHLEPGQPLVVEGIHGLNPSLSDKLPQELIHRVFVSALTCINLDDHNRIRTTDVRLLRRIVRDHLFRGTLPEDTLAMWPSVRRGEETWIFPYQEMADSVFNSALHYELPVLKRYVYDLLDAIPRSSVNYLPARRLCKTLNYFPRVDEAELNEIPPLSLLREFIGGSTLE